MTQRMIDARMKKLEALEAQRKELEARIEAVKADIQDEMGDEELIETPTYIIHWTFTTSSRFDSKTFKAEHGKMYSQYLKETQSRRFSYAAK